MKITTKTGDKGTTGLYGGGRVDKFDLRPEAYGTIDEANSCLGFARNLTKKKRVKDLILSIQKELFTVGTELATLPENLGLLKKRITERHVKKLEDLEEEIEREIKIPEDFIIPSGTLAASCLDLARTIVRRAERRVVELKKSEESLNENLIRYLNRLSDLVYLIARFEEQMED